jgi:hypothetical protein
MKVQEAFAKYKDEYLQFQRVANPRCARPDVHAFLLLEELAPGDGSEHLIVSAEHDRIWLSTDLDKLEEVATEEQLRELHRCGVLFDKDQDSLAMFT